MPRLRRDGSMGTWGDVALVLNGLVREGRIAGFQTSRADKAAEPTVVVRAAPGQSDDATVELVRSMLTGNFVGAAVFATYHKAPAD